MEQNNEIPSDKNKNGNMSADDYLIAADYFRDRQKWLKAISLYRLTLASRDGDDDSQIYSIRMQLAHCLKESGQPLSAAHEYQRIWLNDNNIEAANHLAHLCKNIGFCDFAFKIFNSLKGTELRNEAEAELKTIKKWYPSLSTTGLNLPSIRDKNSFSKKELNINDFEKHGIINVGGTYISLSHDPQIIIHRHQLPDGGLIFDSIENSDRFEIFCDYGSGFEAHGRFRISPYSRSELLFFPPDYHYIRRLRIDPTDVPGSIYLRAYGRHSSKKFSSKIYHFLSAPITILARTFKSTIKGNVDFTDWDHTETFSRHIAYRQANLTTEEFIENKVDRKFAISRVFDGIDIDQAKILISFIVPIYNSREKHLRDLLTSFQEQKYHNFEVILIDDCSSTPETNATLDAFSLMQLPFKLNIIRLPKNQGISTASNAGIDVAQGIWLSFVDHDDRLHIDAMSIICASISCIGRSADLIYTDETLIDEVGSHMGEFCKPAFDPILLSGINYINHLSIYRREKIGDLRLRSQLDGSQDYDFLLRYIKKTDRRRIFHIPYALYHWRRFPGTFSERSQLQAVRAARLALSDAYGGLLVTEAESADTHRIRFPVNEQALVSIIIPTKDNAQLVENCLNGLALRTKYRNFEVIIVDNGSKNEHVFSIYDRFKSTFCVKLVKFNEKFNFSRSINKGLEKALGEFVLLLNDDVEMIEACWLHEMLECMQYQDAAIVGPKLLYPDGKIQHAGVIVGLGNAAGHWYAGSSSDEPGIMGRLRVRQAMSAVTGACMLVRKQWFEIVGGLDEQNFAVAYNDIDFCLRVRQAGGICIYTPHAVLYHHESASRGLDNSGENFERWTGEYNRFQEKWLKFQFEDPAFSPWFDKMSQFPIVQCWKRPPVFRSSTL